MDEVIYVLRPLKRDPQFEALVRSFYESRSTSQVIVRACSELWTEKVEKSIFPTIRVVLVGTRLLE